MAAPYENVSMAVFCDFENVALGVRDAKYEKFDIKPVLERLLLKGSIVVKKAYCDWDRYKTFKATMHEANFELIEIPHVRQSGKNSADIRLVVDALDLCYTKSHVNTFVIISGDSDFSPLVAKLRENAKQVIGVGVKQSTSDLLIANCDEFIFYDDLVREIQRAAAKRDRRDTQPAVKRPADDEKHPKEELEARKSKAIDVAVETFEALASERGESGKIWASTLKQAIKRRKPDFNEAYFGFRAFGNLLDEAQARGLLELGRDEKSGTYVYRGSGEMADGETTPERAAPAVAEQGSGAEAGAASNAATTSAIAPAGAVPDARAGEDTGKQETRRPRGGRHLKERKAEPALTQNEPQATDLAPVENPAQIAAVSIEDTIAKHETRRRRRDIRNPRDRKAGNVSPHIPQVMQNAPPRADSLPAGNPVEVAAAFEAGPAAIEVAAAAIEDGAGKQENHRRRGGRPLREKKAETTSPPAAQSAPLTAGANAAPGKIPDQTTPDDPAPTQSQTPPAGAAAAAKAGGKSAVRNRRPRKTETTTGGTG